MSELKCVITIKGKSKSAPVEVSVDFTPDADGEGGLWEGSGAEGLVVALLDFLKTCMVKKEVEG